MNIVDKVEGKVVRTIRRFGLVTGKDRLLCAVSGGKDSTAALYIMNKLYSGVEAITIDALIGNYSKSNLDNIRKFCDENDIRLHVVSFRQEFGYSLCYIQSILKEKGFDLNSCAVCGVLKRYLLNRFSREFKATALVTGHNMDDEAQSILMNLLRANLAMLAKLGPRSSGVDSMFVPRIKPLYLVSEDEIVAYAKEMRFPVNFSRCPCSADSYRNSVRAILGDYRMANPDVSRNIVDYFLKVAPRLRKNFGLGNLTYCLLCGEPSMHEFCRACDIINKIRKY
jgi:uncharacterized protein (TIGR00269 family)